MTQKIKQFLIILVSIAIPVWVTITPSPTPAESNRGFWEKPFVKDLKTIWTDKPQEDALIHTIQNAINWALWLLSAVALVLVIYAWFLMLTSGWNSKKYNQWISVIKNVAIWLAIIGVSWLIVSLIFYVINGSVETS